MSSDINIDTKGYKKKVAEIRKRLRTIPYSLIGDMAIDMVKYNFDVGGNPDKWKPRKKNKPWPILKKSLTLRNSIYKKPTKSYVLIGSKVPYQAVHNFGFPKRNIAQRKYLVIDKNGQEVLIDVVKSHIIGD